MAKWLKILISVFTVLLVVGVVVAMLVGYFGFISQNMQDDSERHLVEIYEQVNQSFNGFISRNWGILSSCSDYYTVLKQNNDPELDTKFKEFVFGDEENHLFGKKHDVDFEEFYFLDPDRNYYALSDNSTGHFESGDLSDMIANNQKILTRDTPIKDKAEVEVDPDSTDSPDSSEEIAKQPSEVIMFAIPIGTEYSYNGFTFTAVGISYTNAKLAAKLDAVAFKNSEGFSIANSYIIKPNDDGDVLLSPNVDGDVTRKYLRFMKYWLRDDPETFARLKEGIKSIKKTEANPHPHGYLSYTTKDTDGKNVTHCVIYMPIDYGDYMLISNVPQTAVSQGFLQAQTATIRVMLIIFSLIIAVLLVVLIMRIISQSRQSKKELLYREKMFDVLSNNVNDIFLMLDPATETVDYISPNIERLLGIKVKTAKENIRTMATCAVDYNNIIPNEELQSLPMGESRSWECEYMHQATGERRWYRVTIYHMNIQKMEKYVVVMSDRTLDKQLNAQLEEALNAAKSANEAKSNFLSNMSHDIRTPMNAIVGFSVLLEHNADDADAVREYTRKIMASSHHLLSLINDVLDMSKIESGKTSLNVERFSLPDLLEELNIIVMPQAKAKDQEFNIRTNGTPPDEIMGDRLRLNQILLNLLSNAVKYTPEGGKIDFTVQEIEESAQFTKLRFIVKDNGIGMSEDYLKEIFQPFSRETNSVVNKIQGTGLGMAITKNLVDLMGGIIEVESEPGKGSTFNVELSFALVQEQSQDAWFSHKIPRMLVADDEEEICLNIRDMMHDTGIEVSYVTDGAAAVDCAVRAHNHNRDFNVILLDWKMPGMDGVETARRIREQVGEDVPILVLTSYDWSDIEAEARAAGINAFMPKPFFTSTFFQTIKPLFNEPVEAAHVEPAEAAHVEPADDALKGKLFLVAEDNELNAEILTEMMDMEGARCEVAKNGKIAVEMFLKSEPGYYDMILMDVQMPIMNGYEATKTIRASEHPDAAEIPIVAMTANTFAEDVQTALNAGMDAHLAKPIDMEIVRKTVAQLLEKRQKGESK